MTPAETEAARRDLVSAIVRRLQDHDPDTSPLGADAEPFATEVVAMAMQLGWRPVLARPPDWRQARSGRGDGLDPEVMEALRSGDYEAVRAAYKTTSAVPVQRPAPEDDDSND